MFVAVMHMFCLSISWRMRHLIDFISRRVCKNKDLPILSLLEETYDQLAMIEMPNHNMFGLLQTIVDSKQLDFCVERFVMINSKVTSEINFNSHMMVSTYIILLKIILIIILII